MLQPVFFMENWISPWFKPGIDQDQLMIGLQPDTVLQMIAVEDIGRYGRLAFERHEEMNGQAIDIAGDQLTMPQVAEILSEVAGRPIRFVQVPLAEVRRFSEDFATMLEWFDRVGYRRRHRRSGGEVRHSALALPGLGGAAELGVNRGALPERSACATR